VPDAVLGRAGEAGVGGRERILASAESEDGTWLLGTRDRLVLVDPDGEVALLPWERLHRADWDSETATLRVERVQDWGLPVHRSTFVLDDPEALLTLVRERVTASIVVQQRIDLEGRRGLSVVARRPPAGDGEITWACEFDEGVDPSDPSVQVVAEAALRDAKDSLGLA
jgi:hypothetical protein